MNAPQLQIGIALSGGGARGIAHIGVIRALEENGIFPVAISGTSAGSIVGTLYAAGLSPQQMIEFVKDSKFWKIFQIGLPTDGLAKLTYIQERLKAVVQEDDFAALKKELHIAVTNLNRGQCEIRSKGELFNAVVASCSIPLIFKPVEINGEIYVDGGLLNNLPAAPLRPNCDVVLGVNVMPNVPAPVKSLQSAMGIALRTFELSVFANTLPSLTHCDLVIEPAALHRYHIFQFNKFQEIFEIGYTCAMEKMGEIQAICRLPEADK